MTPIVMNRYSGDSGLAYFKWQNSLGALQGRLNIWKFQRWTSPAKSVLDFGCGGGWLLANLPASRRIGVEINEHARECASKNGITVYESLKELESLTVDLIISNHALEHVDDPVATLQALRRHLILVGSIVCVVPLDDWRKDKFTGGPDINEHLYAWTPNTLANCFRRAGFIVERVDILTNAWPPRVVDLYKVLPRPLFHAVCYLYAVALKRRQIRIVASNSGGRDI